MVEKYSYDVYGTPSAESLVGNPYMFTGRRFDSETGNYYYRARFYKPSIGRFLQPDPVSYADSMNLYQYCGNNPINWIDPWGLKDKNASGDILGIPTDKDWWSDWWNKRPYDNFWGPIWDILHAGEDVYHLGAGSGWTAMAAINAAIGYGLQPIGNLSTVGTVTVALPTPSGGVTAPITINLEFIGTTAKFIDYVAGETFREAAHEDLEMAEWHFHEDDFPISDPIKDLFGIDLTP